MGPINHSSNGGRDHGNLMRAKIVDAMDREVSEHAGFIKEATGIEVLPVGLAVLNSYYEKADEKEAAKWADKWTKGAKKVVEPTRGTLMAATPV